MGRLTRDPEVRYSPSDADMAIARYSLAVDRYTKRDQERTTDFINCVAFRGNAKFAERYLKQGMRVLVTGRLQTGSYTNRDGVKIPTAEVIIDEQEFADGKKSNGLRMEKDTQSAEDFVPIDEIPDEALPFN